MKELRREVSELLELRCHRGVRPGMEFFKITEIFIILIFLVEQFSIKLDALQKQLVKV